MKIKTLLFTLSAIPLGFVGGFTFADKMEVPQNCAAQSAQTTQINSDRLKRIDFSKIDANEKFGLDRDLIDSRLWRDWMTRLDAYPEGSTTEDETGGAAEEGDETGVNAKLLAYFTELNDGVEPTEYTFNSLTTLTFDGTLSETCNQITEIKGLDNYRFNAVTQITIKNMANLTAADLSGLIGTRRVFPNLNTIIVDGCDKLSSLNFAGNNALKNIKISFCAQISFTLPDEVCQTLEILSLSNVQTAFNISLTVPKLKTLELVNTGTVAFSVDGYVLENAIITGNSDLLSLDVSASELSVLTLQNNSKLQMLDLSKCVNVKTFNFDKMDFDENGIVVSRNLVYAPDLRTFFLNGNDWLTQFDLSRSPNLQTIVLTSCTNLEKLNLADTLSSLITLDLTECRNLLDVNILSAVNLAKLSLSGCTQLKNAIFENVGKYSRLQYLDLSGTGVQQIDFKDFEELEILFLGSSYLTSVKLDNLPKLYQFEISNSTNLKQIELFNLEKLTNFTPQYCDSIENINVQNTALESFKVSGKNRLRAITLSCAELKSFIVLNCNSLTQLDFAECQNLTALEVVGCASLASESFASLEGIITLESVTVSECSNVYGFSLTDKPNLTELNLSYLNSLTSLSLSNFAQRTRIYLPSKLTGLRSLTLTGLARADFGSDSLDLSHGVLSSARINNVPFAKIDLCDNMLASINISGTKNLKEINLSNNRITNIEAVMTLLATSEQLALVNLNNNRIDFSKSDALKSLKSGIYANCVVLGLQNAINNNKYSYEPKIYYGGTGRNFENIRAVVYHSNATYRISEISDAKLRKFDRSTLVEDRFKKCKNGTYYIVFEKLDSKGNKIEMTEAEQSQFMPVYFVVSKEFDMIKFIWIIFVVVAGLIFVYVGISWLIERRRKERLLGDDVGDITDGGTKLSRKEIKLAEREHRKMFKENDKLDKQERKNKLVANRERSKIDKENAKEQQKMNAENAKLAKIAQKERVKEEKEQRKLDKEREKLLRERGEPTEYKVNDKPKEEKEMKTPEERAREKELKKEQKELKRMEKENLKAEKMREKNEEREILGENNKFANLFAKKTKKVEDDIDFDTDALAANHNGLKENDTLSDDDIGFSDKDLDEILASRSKAAPAAAPAPASKTPTSAPKSTSAPSAPKVPPKPASPKLPPRPKN